MEGNLGNSRKEMDGWDRSDVSSMLGGSSRTSGVTLEDGNSSGFGRKDENVAESIQRGESLSTEWTDKKHCMYLNSIEESFVKQLYCHKYQLTDLHSRLSRKQKALNQKSLQSNRGNYSSSGQLKVLHKGCWENVYFGTDERQLDKENEYQHLLGNPWIQHFRTTPKGKRLEETFPGQNNKIFGSGSIHFGRPKYQMTACGMASSSKQPHNQDSIGSNTEMSDQNFVDDGYDESKELTSLFAKKRARTVSVDDSSKDQVVPSGMSLVAADTTENHVYGHSENKTSSGRMKSVAPSFEDP